MTLPAKPFICPDCARLSSVYMVESNHTEGVDGNVTHQWKCNNCGWRDRIYSGGGIAGPEIIRGRPHKDWHAAGGHDRLTAADLALPNFAELTFAAGQITWTDMPLLTTEFLGSIVSRTKANLTGLNQARLLVAVITAGASTAELRCRYSTDQTTWTRLDIGDVLDPETEVSIGTTGLKDSGWTTLTAGAKADVFLRIEGEGGDLLADPVFGKISLQVK